MKIRMPSKLKLTIGMIVKNEQKHIRNCLEALKPLMEQVESELIIADTGSTDETLAIAKEYTDQAFSFEWVGDFSAARNATVDKASGEWYMFLDADEYLQDTGDMARFFNGKEQKKYNTATFIIRSFHDFSGQDYSDFRGIRCTRLGTGARFHNKIHEYLPVIPPIKHLETVADHYGYVYESAEAAQVKQKRNMDLMEEERKETPDSTRLMTLIYDSAPEERKKEALEHGLDLVRKKKNDVYYMPLYQRAMEYYTRKQDFEKAEEIGREYFREKPLKECATDIDMYALFGNLLKHLGRPDEAIGAYEKYLQLYQKFQNGTLYTDDMIYTMVSYTHPVKYLWVLQELANLYSDSGQMEQAADTALLMDYQKLSLQHYQSLLMTMCNIFERIQNPDRFAMIYRKTRELEDPEKTGCLLQTMEQYYYQHEQEREPLAGAIAGIVDTGDPYVQQMELVVTQAHPHFTDMLDSYISNAKSWGPGYTEAFFLAIRYNRSILPVIESQSCDELDNLLGRLAEYHRDDLAEQVYGYTKGDELTGTVKGAYVYTSLLSRGTAFADSQGFTHRVQIYKRFTKKIADYMGMIYSPQMLTGDELEVLPPLHRFGICMRRAYGSQDDVAYVKHLREALKQCPEMKQVISDMLTDFERQNKGGRDEFDGYADKVKKKIIEIAKNGMLEEAKKLAAQYLKLRPDDTGIMEEICGRGQFQIESRSYLLS